MKVFLIVLLTMLSCVLTFDVHAQWTTSGTNIYNSNTGNVGIGTSTPGALLHLQSNAGEFLRLQSNASTGNLYIRGTDGSGNAFFVGRGSSDDGVSLWNYKNSSISFGVNNTEKVRIDAAGNVGIGTSNPGALLHLQSNAGEFLRLQSNASTGNLYIRGTDGSGNAFFVGRGSSDDGVSLWSYRNSYISFGVNNTEKVRIDATGNVGIGTTTPDQKLSVNGTIHSKSVLVDLTGWSDFVFKPTYYLRPLAEVKAYIDQHHHLPDVPAAAEVEKKGLDVGEMNKILMQKVEELTLYLIEKDKTEMLQKDLNKQLQEELQSQKARFAEQQRQIDKNEVLLSELLLKIKKE